LKKEFIIAICLFASQVTTAQNYFRAIVKDEKTGESLIGATVVLRGSTNGATADINGKIELSNIPDGRQVLVISLVGYRKRELDFTFPLADENTEKILFMEPSETDLEEVTITTSTRSSRTIANIPTRIETIAGGELEEKSVMQPGNIKMILTESTGIQTQQTSQVSGSASIRIQGLDGKYTQLLQDGFPLYSGFASGLSILQIPPLNLKRVELIKGSASTLYGGGAIAGLINLITKEPTEKRELSSLVNGNQTSALDVSAFYSEKYKKTGVTMYAAGNLQKAYDNNRDGFSDIPEFSRFTISPKFYYYPTAKATLSVGLNTGFEKRTGGDLVAVKGVEDPTHVYFERNNSQRISTQAKYEQKLDGNRLLTLKNSVGYFNRKITRPTYSFEGQQVATFSEANYHIPGEKAEWNFGLNYVTDNFNQLHKKGDQLDYVNNGLGVFAQNNLSLTSKLIVESGFRVDLANGNKIFALPRLSVLYKITENLTTRLGGGLGYKMPTVFSEDAEARAFQDIIPLDFSKVSPEKSYGLNADLNFKTTIDEEVSIAFNQMFFYTRIQSPIILSEIGAGSSLEFVNANGNIETKGFETNAKVRFEDISFFAGYTYLEAVRNFNSLQTVNPLTAKHRINATVMFEMHEKLRLAYEVFYVGQQYLTTSEKVRDYWVMGVSAEYKFKHFSLFFNLENFMDTRQSRWEPLYSGSIQNPQFRDVYTPTDGFIFNGGFKLYL